LNHYFYKCFQCQSKFSVEEIEKDLNYLCPKCGKAKKNHPLEGVLWIEYDYEKIKNEVNKDTFLKLPTGRFWEYPQLLPLEYNNHNKKYTNLTSAQLNRLQLNEYPLLRYEIENRPILVFDDTRNPTLSFKDRASSLVAVKATQLGICEIAAASTGNAGSSLAGICARLGLHAHLFVPSNIPTGKRIQIQSYGANLYLVDGDYDMAFDLCLEASTKKGWYNRNTAYNPLTIEGKKFAAYDIYITTKGNVPDVIFVAVGDGVIVSGIYKGFLELRKLGMINNIPELVGVQAKGSDALVRYMEKEQFEYLPASTIADSICAGAPRNLYMATHSIRESGGTAIAVNDEEILAAQKIAAQDMGLLIEPAAAASLAGYLKIKDERIIKNKKVMLSFTGNGLKDLDSLVEWNIQPELRSVEDWKIHFNKKD
jgi:threonine synthase